MGGRCGAGCPDCSARLARCLSGSVPRYDPDDSGELTLVVEDAVRLAYPLGTRYPQDEVEERKQHIRIAEQTVRYDSCWPITY